MAYDLYERIKMLCASRGVSISGLENQLGFGTSTIKKWRGQVSPSIDKIVKVANFFGVSSDYLLGRTDMDFLPDKELITLQRARMKMTPKDRIQMMKLLEAGFEYAFSEDEEND